MTFRGLIGACVLLTAPAAAFGQKPTAAKQPVAADSAAAQPAEKQPAARIVVFRERISSSPSPFLNSYNRTTNTIGPLLDVFSVMSA